VEITKIGVIGAGTMGSGIAEVCARGGVGTTVIELDESFLPVARSRIEASLQKAVDRGRLEPSVREAAIEALGFSTELDALGDVDLVIEAVVEDRELKVDLFTRLDRATKPTAILASNTSSIPLTGLGAATERPEQVLGMHFFNPAQVQPLVELVRSAVTAEATLDLVEHFTTTTLDKTVIRCEDRAGFVVNRLLVPFLLQAIELLDTGHTTVADIDRGMKLGCAHPMGPLELCDLIGLDTIENVADVLYVEYRERFHAPPPLLRRMVTAGHLGRKSGKGFYDYD